MIKSNFDYLAEFDRELRALVRQMESDNDEVKMCDYFREGFQSWYGAFLQKLRGGKASNYFEGICKGVKTSNKGTKRRLQFSRESKILVNRRELKKIFCDALLNLKFNEETNEFEEGDMSSVTTVRVGNSSQSEGL
mmetsp:Transcript_16719/g.28342  ORF Transcript_16719/g.28342 Transcript_16719/m.28342 type:complete len:136 (+) Transcript_16719:187-594(+)